MLGHYGARFDRNSKRIANDYYIDDVVLASVIKVENLVTKKLRVVDTKKGIDRLSFYDDGWRSRKENRRCDKNQPTDGQTDQKSKKSQLIDLDSDTDGERHMQTRTHRHTQMHNGK